MVTGWSSLPPRNAYRYAGEESDAAFPGGAILPRLGPPELTRPAAFNSTVEQFSSTQSVSGSVTYCERCDFRYGSWLRTKLHEPTMRTLVFSFAFSHDWSYWSQSL